MPGTGGAGLTESGMRPRFATLILAVIARALAARPTCRC